MNRYNEIELKEDLINKVKKMLNDIEMYNMEIEFVLLDKNNIENS